MEPFKYIKNQVCPFCGAPAVSDSVTTGFNGQINVHCNGQTWETRQFGNPTTPGTAQPTATTTLGVVVQRVVPPSRPTTRREGVQTPGSRSNIDVFRGSPTIAGIRPKRNP